MDNGIVLMRCAESLEMVSLRLQKLNNMINTICLGMEQERMEQQMIDCIESIGYCVNDIKNIAVDKMKQFEEIRKQCAKGNEA